jgi:hypothetical protein
MKLGVRELWVDMLVMKEAGSTNAASTGAVSSDLKLDFFPNLPVEPTLIDYVSPGFNAYWLMSKNHGGARASFR